MQVAMCASLLDLFFFSTRIPVAISWIMVAIGWFEATCRGVSFSETLL